jgi:transposase-like protein
MRTRRKFTGEFKSRVVLEVLSGEKTAGEACREYELTGQMINDWKAQFLAAAPQVFEKETANGGEQERIAELEQMVGKLTMQLEIAKKASRWLDGTSSRNGKRR